MLRVDLNVEGAEKVAEELKALPGKAQADLIASLTKTGQVMARDLRAELAVKAAPGESSGPGQPPLSQSGGLLRSIGIRLIERYGEAIRLVVGSVKRIGGDKNWAFHGQIVEVGARKYQKGFERSHKSTAWLERVSTGELSGRTATYKGSWFKRRAARAAADAKAQISARKNATMRMEARPWMLPVLKVYEEKFVAVYNDFMKRWFPGA